MIHGKNAAVRVLDYFVEYGNGDGLQGYASGGIGTKLTGVVYYSPRAESHKGYCHGGSMCSLMDDIIGWCGFVTTGKCVPWSGYTVQINTALRQPIKVGSFLVASATITKIERRKVWIQASLFDPEAEGDSNVIHAEGDGLVILNAGALSENPCNPTTT